MKQKVLALFFLCGFTVAVTAQPWNWDFGNSTTAAWMSGGSTTFFSQSPPPSGTGYVYVTPSSNGLIKLDNESTNGGVKKLGSGARLRLAATKNSTTLSKISVYNYSSPSSSFYTKFTILLGPPEANSIVSSGEIYFFQGNDNGTNNGFSNANLFTANEIFIGLQFKFIYNSSPEYNSTIQTNYYTGSNWNNLHATAIKQNSVCTVEIFGNNSTLTKNYTYNSANNSVGSGKFDIWINGTLIGNDKSKVNSFTSNNTIDSWMFYGQNTSSTSASAANLFLDDITYSNSIPSSVTTVLNYYLKPSGYLDSYLNYTTNIDGTGYINGSSNLFTVGNKNIYIRNNSSPNMNLSLNVTGTNTKIFVGDGSNSCTFNINKDVTSPEMTVNSNANILVYPNQFLTMNGNLIVNNTGSVTIKSDDSGTGSLLMNGTSTYSGGPGSFNVERYITGQNWFVAPTYWHLLSSPVQNQAISAFETTGSGNDYGFYGWSEAYNLWINYKNTTTSPTFSEWNGGTKFIEGRGYMISYQQTQNNKKFTGIPYNSDKTWSNLSYSSGPNCGWHLLGNPFPSALKWNDGNWALNNVSSVAKIWHSVNNSYSDINSNDIIPIAQGFMIQVNNGTNSIKIPLKSRVHNNTTAWYKAGDTNRLLLIASPTDGSSAQESVIRIEKGSTHEFDFYYDSRFLAGYAPQFYCIVGNERLSTQSVPSIEEGIEFLYGFLKNDRQEFRIRLAENPFPIKVYLKDLKTGVTQCLSDNPEYVFISAEGDAQNRFKLYMGSVGIDEPNPTQPGYSLMQLAISSILPLKEKKE
jgi:hypothetical protein